MPHLKGLTLAIELATRQRDEAMAALMQAQLACQGAQDQMVQLESYARDTQSHWALGARTHANPEIIRHYDQFMDRLQQAVGLQQSVVNEQFQVLDETRQRLMAAEIRMASFKRLLEKRRTVQSRVQAAREQKQLDELAALQFRRLHANPETTGTP